ncbi:PAS domain S-box protein [bacterium]|nr:PAS domain S-box protein [bacterium]
MGIPEKVYEELYSKSGILYFLLDLEGCIVSHNVIVEEKLGYDKNELKGKNFLSLFSQTEQKNVDKLIHSCVVRGYIKDVEASMLDKYGRYLYVKMNGLTENNSQGDAVSVRLYIKDVSKMTRLERQNHFHLWLVKTLQGEKLSKGIVEEILSEIQHVMESEGIGLSIQKENGENVIFGHWSELDVESDNRDDHFQEWSIDYWKEFIDACEGVEGCRITPSGVFWTHSLSDVIIKIQSNEVRDRLLSLTEFESLLIVPLAQSDEIRGYLVLVHHAGNKWDEWDIEFMQGIAPILAGIEAEQPDLTMVTHEIDSSLFHVPIFGVFIVQGGIIQFANNWIAELLEWSPDEIHGKSFTAFVDPEYHDKIYAIAHQEKNEEASTDCHEMVLLTKSQNRVYVDCVHVHTMVRETSTDIWYWINKENYERIQKHLMQARKMESFGMLAGGIVHDFNNLLACILGFSSLLSEEIPEESPYYEDILQITRTAEKATELTSRLMAYAQDGSYIVNNLDINQLVKEVAGILSRTLDKRISIRADLDPKLVTLKADASQIQQAILQVALNARDAIPDGGKIHFQTRNIFINEDDARLRSGVKPGRYVQITVNDTGLGMSGHVKERMFERDFTTKNRTAGKGLGLSMVQEIVDNHNGFISVFSEKSKGTVFKIHLPASNTKIHQAQSLSGEKPPLGKETILLVDDERVLRETARKMLTRYGYKVISAESGTEAASIYKKYVDRIDLIILDLIMPGMGVDKVITWMKKLNPKVKIMATSEVNELELKKSSQYQNVSGFIQKPFQVRPLLKKVRSILNA